MIEAMIAFVVVFAVWNCCAAIDEWFERRRWGKWEG